MAVGWCADIDISVILFLNGHVELPENIMWAEHNKYVDFKAVYCPVNDENPNWSIINELLPEMITFILPQFKVRFIDNIIHILSYKSQKEGVNILIADASCTCLSPAILSIILLLKYQIRIKETLKICEEF